MPLSIGNICFGIQLPTVVFTGRFFDTQELGEVIGMYPGTVAPEIVFRVVLCLARRKWTVVFVSGPVPPKGVQSGVGQAAGFVGTSVRT